MQSSRVGWPNLPISGNAVDRTKALNLVIDVFKVEVHDYTWRANWDWSATLMAIIQTLQEGEPLVSGHLKN